MKNIVRIIGVSLASMAGILLVSGVAWAQAEKRHFTYRIGSCEILGPPEREWVDEDGIQHVRDQRYRCNRIRQIIGEEVGWWNADDDLAGGHTFVRAYYSFTGTVLGDSATGAGRVTEECNRIEGVWNCTGHDVMHLHDGRLVTGSATWERGENPFWSGILLDPPGRRVGPKARKR